MSDSFSWFSVEDDSECFEERLDSLEKALNAADTYVVCRDSSEYLPISIFEEIWTSVDGGKTYSFTERYCVDTIYNTSATDEYYSDSAIAARQARADEIRSRSLAIKEDQLYRRPLVPRKAEWETRYDWTGATYRLKPEFR